MTPFVALLLVVTLNFAPVIVEPTGPKVGEIVSITLPVGLADGERIVEARSVAFPADSPIGSVVVLDPAGSLKVTVEARQAGPLSTGPIEYVVALPDGETAIRTVTPEPVEVASNLAPGDDGAPAFDESVAEVPFDWRTAIIPSAVAVMTLALIVALGLWLKRRLSGKQKDEPPLSPYQRGLDRLTALEGEGLYAQGEVRRHFYQVSEIVREYVEGRYGLSALERTTFELDRDLKKRSALSSLRDPLLPLLKLCDRVKFSTDGEATPDEAAHALAEARRIVGLDPDRGLEP